ncbi:TetR/AcrR family transcriptional regulator [Nocardioides pacificus]
MDEQRAESPGAESPGAGPPGIDRLGRRERNKRATRERLLDAARGELAEHEQFTTVEAIADRADVSRATFFNYFGTKADLVHALYAEHMSDLALLVDDVLARDLSTQARVSELFADFVRSTERRPGYLRAATAEFERTFLAPDVVAEHTDLFTTQVLRILEVGLEREEVRADYPLRFLAEMVGAVYVSTIRYWRQQADYDLQENFTRAGRFVSEAISAPR